MNSRPLISVIINCYNGEKFIDKCIQSVLNQTYKYYEIIFWNNKSEDNSLSLIKKYNDSRLKIFDSKSHTNLSQARNEALKVSQGEYICFLDVDDYWDKNKLENQIETFKNKNIGLSFTNFWYVKSSSGEETKQKINLNFSEGFTKKIIKKYEIVISTIMFKSVFLKNNQIKFDEDYHIISDFDFVLKLSLITELYHLEQYLTYRHWHGENESIKKREQAVWEIEDWLNKNYKNYNNYQDELKYIKIKIFNDKLNFLIKKKNIFKSIIFFLNSNTYLKFNYMKYIFFRIINKLKLGK